VMYMQYIFFTPHSNQKEKQKKAQKKNTGTTEICRVKNGFSFSFIHETKRKDVGKDLFRRG